MLRVEESAPGGQSWISWSNNMKSSNAITQSTACAAPPRLALGTARSLPSSSPVFLLDPVYKMSKLLFTPSPCAASPQPWPRLRAGILMAGLVSVPSPRPGTLRCGKCFYPRMHPQSLGQCPAHSRPPATTY